MTKRPQNRTVLLVGVLVALLLAGVASFYASSHPDGLEYVAEQTGFIDTAEDHAAAGGPLADYATKGVDDARVSTGLAGVIGSLVVLALAGGLALVLRKRRGNDGSNLSSDGSNDGGDLQAAAPADGALPRGER